MRLHFDAMQHVPPLMAKLNQTSPMRRSLLRLPNERKTRVHFALVSASADAEMGRKRVAVQQLIADIASSVAVGLTSILCNVKNVHPLPELEPSFMASPMLIWTSNQYQQYLFRHRDCILARFAERAARYLPPFHRC